MRRQTHRRYGTFSVTVLPFTRRQSCSLVPHPSILVVPTEGKEGGALPSRLQQNSKRSLGVRNVYSYGERRVFHYVSLEIIMEALQTQVSLPRNGLRVTRQ
jgi:hypothetical protein